MQFKHWDSKPTTDNSFYNLVTQMNFNSATASTNSFTQNCGAKDLLTGTSTATLNKGPTVCAKIGDFQANANYAIPGYAGTESQGGWTTSQTGAVRNFIELPSGTTTLKNLAVGDTVEFMAGFKYYKPITTNAPSAYSTTDPIATATSTVHSYTVLDSAMFMAS